MTDQYKRVQCDSCRVRSRVAPLALRDYNTVRLSQGQLLALEFAAAHFDAESEERWSATEFIRWLRPDVPGTPEYQAVRGGGEYELEPSQYRRPYRRKRVA